MQVVKMYNPATVARIHASGIKPLPITAGTPDIQADILMMYSSDRIPIGVAAVAISAAIKAVLRPVREANQTPAVLD